MKLTLAVRQIIAGTPAHRPPPDPRCSKYTVKGPRCSFPHLPGDDLCALHREIANEKLAS